MGSAEKQIWETCGNRPLAGVPSGRTPSVPDEQMHIENLPESRICHTSHTSPLMRPSFKEQLYVMGHMVLPALGACRLLCSLSFAQDLARGRPSSDVV